MRICMLFTESSRQASSLGAGDTSLVGEGEIFKNHLFDGRVRPMVDSINRFNFSYLFVKKQD